MSDFEFEFAITKALDIIYALLKAGDVEAAIAFLEEALK